jgi:DNA-binding transcriptional ArsR family regulator
MKKFFKDVAILNEDKLDKFVYELFLSIFTGMGGRYTRLKILCEIIEIPLNASQISKKLNMDYKTASYNLSILLKNNLIIKKGTGYGNLYFPAEIVTSNLSTLYTVIRKAEVKLDKSKKKYID